MMIMIHHIYFQKTAWYLLRNMKIALMNQNIYQNILYPIKMKIKPKNKIKNFKITQL